MHGEWTRSSGTSRNESHKTFILRQLISMDGAYTPYKVGTQYRRWMLLHIAHHSESSCFWEWAVCMIRSRSSVCCRQHMEWRTIMRHVCLCECECVFGSRRRSCCFNRFVFASHPSHSECITCHILSRWSTVDEKRKKINMNKSVSYNRRAFRADGRWTSIEWEYRDAKLLAWTVWIIRNDILMCL